MGIIDSIGKVREGNSASALTLCLARAGSSEWRQSGEGVYFIFPWSGKGEVLLESGSLRFSAYDVVVVSGSPQCRIKVAENDELNFWYFYAEPQNFFFLFAPEELWLLHSALADLKNTKIYPAAGALATTCHRLLKEIPPKLSIDHRAHLVRIAATVFASEFERLTASAAQAPGADSHVSDVLEHLTTEEFLEASVDQLALKVGFSRRHLTRLFRQRFGISVNALQMELRLLKAVALLRDPSAKIIGVAQRCGFRHLGLFNTCFKKRFGRPPGVWRAQMGPAPSLATLEPLGKTRQRCQLSGVGLCPLFVGSQPAQPQKLAQGAPTKARQRQPVPPAKQKGAKQKSRG